MYARFGDIVVPHDEGIVVNSDSEAGIVVSSGAEGFDMQQDFFADDLIGAGDEGLGFAQARALRRKLGRNRRRITTTGRYAVAGNAPYQFGDLGKLRISFKHPFGKKSILGGAARTAVSVAKVALPVVAAGGGAFLGFKAGKGLLGLLGKGRRAVQAVATSGPPGTPAPAASLPVDAAGQLLPSDITNAAPVVSPVPDTGAATASEDVASQAADGSMPVQAAGVLGGVDVKSLVPLALIGLGAFALSRMGSGRSRRRRRR